MTRFVLLSVVILAATPAWAQEATEVAAPIPAASEVPENGDVPDATTAEEDGAPADPVATWEADPTAILESAEIDLDAFEYVARPLVIFADSPRQPQFVEQMRLIATDIDNLADREVAIIVDTDPEARTAVRRELRPRGFGIVLVDKDGRVTLRQPGPIAVREIARAIDRTPIRREELREGRRSVPSD